VRRENGNIRSRNGTTFFLDAGEGAFAVTAAHVIDGWLKDGAGPLRVAGDGHAIQVDWDARVISVHSEMDIATFKIESEEVTALGKSVLTRWWMLLFTGTPQFVQFDRRGRIESGSP